MDKYENIREVSDIPFLAGWDNLPDEWDNSALKYCNGTRYYREVDSYYENGVFYVMTWAKSNKMQQIAQNNEVAFSVCNEGIYGSAIGENLGWVLDPKNTELRAKLREVFAKWYDAARYPGNPYYKSNDI